MNNKLQRTRIVSFRTSSEEYDSLVRRSDNSGARSVSEFARSVTCRDNSEESNLADSAKLGSSLSKLHQIVADLEQKIEQLNETLSKNNRNEAPGMQDPDDILGKKKEVMKS
jgi:hypothetical protein